jgi:hypothetical protein
MRSGALFVVVAVIGVAASAGCRSKSATDAGSGGPGTIDTGAPPADVKLDATSDAVVDTGPTDVGSNAEHPACGAATTSGRRG